MPFQCYCKKWGYLTCHEFEDLFYRLFLKRNSFFEYFLGNTKGDDDSQFTSKVTKYNDFFSSNTMIFFAQLQFFKSITFCMIVLLYPPNRLSAHSMDFRIFCRLTARYQNLFICYCGLTYIVLLIMANLMITMQKNRKLLLQYSDILFLIKIALYFSISCR